MTLRQYLSLMVVATILSWIAWFFVAKNINPEQADGVGLLFFYSSLFLSIVGTFSVVGFLIRRAIVKNDEMVFRHVSRTFRQSLIVATLIMLLLFLLARRLLNWWNIVVLIALLFAVEGVIFANRKFSNKDYVR